LIKLIEMKKGNQLEAKILRLKAEELLKSRQSKNGLFLSEIDSLKLIHELEVHQIELELQNEELVLAKQRELDVAEDKYTILYDFAPTGYFTLSPKGEIIQLNLLRCIHAGKRALSSVKQFVFLLRFTRNKTPFQTLFR
jgi:hypothetical protein